MLKYMEVRFILKNNNNKSKMPTRKTMQQLLCHQKLKHPASSCTYCTSIPTTNRGVNIKSNNN